MAKIQFFLGPCVFFVLSMNFSNRNIIYRAAVFAIFFIVALTSTSQVIVTGRVTEKRGEPLPYVKVNVAEASPVMTDTRGTYRITLPVADSARIEFSLMGYRDTTVVTVLRGTSMILDIVLQEKSELLDELQVVARQNEGSPYSHIKLSDVQQMVGPAANVEWLVKTLPDVSSNNELSSQYSVRGGSYDENLVYLNGVEIIRPQLVRSGQQEGQSIVNPDLVDRLDFSPGGFEARFGDKMSSVLDITYRRPQGIHGRVSASLLGGTASVEGSISNFSFLFGARQHSNSYIFKTLDTKGTYNTSYTDIQTILSYKISHALDISFLGIWSRNRYGLVPLSQTTTFGSFMETLQLDIYFDGQESDRYNTLLGSIALDWHPSETFSMKWGASVQSNTESELYDIQDQYWLYELAIGSTIGQVNRFDRGVGTFLKHARNRLATGVYSTKVEGVHYAPLGAWRWGLNVSYERTHDRVSEWKWVDSAGYSMPTTYEVPGDSLNEPHSPILQFYANADNMVHTIRTAAYLQREYNWITDRESDLRLTVGGRVHYYSMSIPVANTDSTAHNRQVLFSPRINFSVKPRTKARIMFRTAAGLYQQPPFYRELRRSDGTLNPDVKAQCSYQLTQSLDWDFKILKKPFRLTTDLYGKFVDHLVPYTIDNLRIRYAAENSAQAYAYGLSMRLNGEFVEGLESWASISIMQTKELVKGDGYGWQPRPSDQLFSFKCFLQDYIPKMRWWRMSLTLFVGTGTPVSFPYQTDRSSIHRLPTYFRVDWGNSIQLSRFPKLARTKFFHVIDDIMISLDVFNLFNYHNVVSYLWVADYQNTYYPVPNYLTARQLNVKLTMSF